MESTSDQQTGLTKRLTKDKLSNFSSWLSLTLSDGAKRKTKTSSALSKQGLSSSPAADEQVQKTSYNTRTRIGSKIQSCRDKKRKRYVVCFCLDQVIRIRVQ